MYIYIAIYVYIHTYGLHPLSEKCFHLMKDSPFGMLLRKHGGGTEV